MPYICELVTPYKEHKFIIGRSKGMISYEDSSEKKPLFFMIRKLIGLMVFYLYQVKLNSLIIPSLAE